MKRKYFPTTVPLGMYGVNAIDLVFNIQLL